jgi:hypothetical protein
LNQNVSLKTKHNEPHKAIAYLYLSFIEVVHSFSSNSIDKYTNRIVDELESTDTRFILNAGSVNGRKSNNFAMIRNNGAPGGWGTCCHITADVNSPQSQKGIEV